MEIVALERTLTALDHARLLNLLRRDAPGAESPAPMRAFHDMLDAVTLTPSRKVAPDVVAMHTQVLLQHARTGQRTRLTLCYPADAEPAAGFVSVPSPVGSALLGLRVGSTAHSNTPAGDQKAAEILAIPFQSESSGDDAMQAPLDRRTEAADLGGRPRQASPTRPAAASCRSGRPSRAAAWHPA